MISKSISGLNVLTCDADACLSRVVIAPEMLFPDLWIATGQEHFCSMQCEEHHVRRLSQAAW